jgi:hypothetical protein
MSPVTTIEAPATPDASPRTKTARVAVVRTRPETVIADYARVMDLAGYRNTLSRDRGHAHQAESLVDQVLSLVLVAAVAGRRRNWKDAERRFFTQAG